MKNSEESKVQLKEDLRKTREELAIQKWGLEKTLGGMKVLVKELIQKGKEIGKAKAKDEAILTSIGDSVMACDEDGQVMLFNTAAEALSGFSAKEIIGHHYSQSLKFIRESDEKSSNDFIAETIKTGQGKRMENHILLVTKDGRKIPVADSAAPIKNAQGEIIGCVLVFRDMIKDREIDKAKSEFLSIASHELRAPLGIIKAFISMIFDGDYGEVSPKLAPPLQDVLSSTERVIHLVNDMLNVSRMEAGRMLFKLSEFPIEPLIRDVALGFAQLAKENGTTVEMKNIDKDLVQADQDKARELLNNLISNAIKFTDRGTITLYTKKEGEFVFIFVADTGIGIAKDDQKKIFDKFQQATSVERGKPQGTGLGLYICQLLGQKMGGKVWLDSSSPGKGSTFAFSLPITGTTAAQKAKKDIEEEVKSHPDQKPLDKSHN